LAKKRIELKGIHDIIESKRKIYNELDILFKFLDKKIKYVLVYTYHGYDILTLEDALKSKDNSFKGDIKLVTLFGSSEGNLQYKINQYRDGSGSGNDNVWFFETENEAKEYMIKKLEEDVVFGKVDYWSISECIKMKEKYDIKSDIFDKRIEGLREIKHKNEMERIQKLENEIELIKKEMK
jgi:hypothetical protein